MAVVFPEKLLDYEWLLYYNAYISFCSGDYKHDLMALLLTRVELRGRVIGRKKGDSFKLSIFFSYILTFSLLLFIGLQSLQSPLRNRAFICTVQARMPHELVPSSSPLHH